MDRKALRGSLLLLLGSVIWGAAFAMQRMGMEHLGPFTFTGIRMLLAGLVMMPAAALAGKGRESGPAEAQRRRDQRKGGLLCGLFLFAATSLQQVGLVYTGAGKAGFLTALLRGCGPARAVQLAAAAGACCVTAYDALSGLTDFDKMAARIDAGWAKVT